MKKNILAIVEKVARKSAHKAVSSQSDWWCYQTVVPKKLLHKAK